MANYKAIKSLDEVAAYLDGAAVVGFDFETAPTEEYREQEMAALDPHKADIVGVSLSVRPDTGIYIPLRHKRAERNLPPAEAMAGLAALVFENADVVKVAHNLSFETMFLYKAGILLCPPLYDTIAAAQMTLKNHLEFRGLGDSGLKTLVPELLGVQLPSFEEVTGGRFFDELDADDPDTVRYAAADSDFAMRLYTLFNKWFDRYLPAHRKLVEEMESPVAVFVGLMKYNGVAVDKALILQKQFEAEEQIAALRAQITKAAGREIDLGENAVTGAFKQYLYQDLGLPVVKTTAKFQQAADEEAIILLKGWCAEHRPDLLPLLAAVQEFRKWKKIKSTYIDGYLCHVNDATGRIHCGLFPLGTDTGRFSSSRPNLQNLPRKDNDPVGIRNFFVPAEGHVFLDFDFSQIELRVGAWYCQDTKMLEVYQGGGDIHAQTTAVIYGISFDEAADKNAPHYKERRSIAKNCNFGVFYGLFAAGLQRNLKKAGIDKTKAECETIIANLKDGYPCLAEWQQETKQVAARNGYSETALGRRRILKGIHSGDWGTKSYWERCALNTPIQGTAADVLKIAMVRLLAGLKERPFIKPLLTIHDEILFEVPADRAAEAARFICACMEAQPFWGFDVPLLAEGATGVRFGELEELDERG